MSIENFLTDNKDNNMQENMGIVFKEKREELF